MKKLILGLIVSVFALNIQAQEAADKKIQAGIIAGYGMNFQNMGTDRLQSNGIGSDFTIGANVTIGFSEALAFNTGLEFDFESLKYKAGTNSVYYSYDDKSILRLDSYKENGDAIDNSINLDNVDAINDNNYFRLDQRKQEVVYLTIPTMLVFRTNFIGYFRYFGKFGLRTSFALSSKSTDIGSDLQNAINTPNGVEFNEVGSSNKDMKSDGDQFFIKSAVGLSGGAEWNFTGGTSLVGEIGYFYGFTPLYWDRDYFVDSNGEFANHATQSQLQLKVSILF
ncbi:MAG: PorT family protein [Crocinitomicaceae bacterium]|nr:PorT family protein [Crocinitomicaceae bacterium]